jgi:hypothetical protein
MNGADIITLEQRHSNVGVLTHPTSTQVHVHSTHTRIQTPSYTPRKQQQAHRSPRMRLGGGWVRERKKPPRAPAPNTHMPGDARACLRLQPCPAGNPVFGAYVHAASRCGRGGVVWPPEPTRPRVRSVRRYRREPVKIPPFLLLLPTLLLFFFFYTCIIHPQSRHLQRPQETPRYPDPRSIIPPHVCRHVLPEQRPFFLSRGPPVLVSGGIAPRAARCSMAL